MTETGREEIRLCVDRAREAARFWASRTVPQRREYLLTVRDVLVDRFDEIVATIISETGKTRNDAVAGEMAVTLDLISYYARRANGILAPERVSPGLLLGKRAFKIYEPLGVVAVISPWNYPFYLTLAPVVTALMAGNAVVMKPSEVTPLVGKRVVELFEAAAGRLSHTPSRIPASAPLVQAIYGGGRTGEDLVMAGVDKIAFTGSVKTGKKVRVASSASPAPPLLELGGKDPMIVCGDADVERAANAAVWGGFTNSGQTCISVERAYVCAKIYDEFLCRVVKKAQRVRPGEDIGPMTLPSQLEIVEDHIADARGKGARVLHGGESDHSLGSLYYKPTVLADVDHSMKIMREETFGPVLPIMKVSDEEEALELANDTPYGLNSSIFSRSKERGRSLASRLVSGGVCINDVLISSAVPGLPYGGRKASGSGYAHGREGLLEFCRAKAVVEDRLGLSRELHWLPTSRVAAPAFGMFATLRYRRGIRNKLRNLWRHRNAK